MRGMYELCCMLYVRMGRCVMNVIILFLLFFLSRNAFVNGNQKLE